MLERAQGWYHRYGRWSLLMSWAPVIGDPLTVVAGVLREPLWSFLLLSDDCPRPRAMPCWRW